MNLDLINLDSILFDRVHCHSGCLIGSFSLELARPLVGQAMGPLVGAAKRLGSLRNNNSNSVNASIQSSPTTPGAPTSAYTSEPQLLANTIKWCLHDYESSRYKQ